MGELCIISYSDRFGVKLPDTCTIEHAQIYADQTNTRLPEQSEWGVPNWYWYSATKMSDGNSLEMANYFQESGIAIATSPSIGRFPVE